VNAQEADWIIRARRGDQAACRQLFEAHARAVYRVALRVLGDAALAEDAVQDCFINAFRALDQYDGRAPFGQWLKRIAINAAAGIVRRRREFAPLNEDFAASVAAASADEPTRRGDAAMIQTRLRGALERLSPLERSAFVLRHLEQHSLDEIARALDSNANAIKQVLFRGVAKLRLALAPLREELS
jgi:RNA polymerase sigma-70 factor (ECF subfamily)